MGGNADGPVVTRSLDGFCGLIVTGEREALGTDGRERITLQNTLAVTRSQ